MDITLQAKRIIFQILVLIMKADSITKEEEVYFLDRVFAEFGLSLDEFDHMDDLDKDSRTASTTTRTVATCCYCNNSI